MSEPSEPSTAEPAMSAPPGGRICRNCHTEISPPPRRGCSRCSLARRLDAVLQDGTGAVSTDLEPLRRTLLESPRPESARGWLYKPHVAPLLRELATGTRAVTHEALHTYPHAKVAMHVRMLLVISGLLPAVDKLLLDFEVWLHRRLADLVDHPHERLLRQFGQWHQLPRLRATAALRPLRGTAHLTASRQINAAADFLTWLHDHGRHPAATNQTDIDTWYATHKVHERQAVRSFWLWATTAGHMPALTLPRMRFTIGTAMSQQRRLDLLRHHLTDDSAALTTRVAVCLMLLYAQPLPRILALTTDDITYDPAGDMTIRFGDPATPVPPTVAPLLQQLIDEPETPTSAHRPVGRWLFPGRLPGQSLHHNTLLKRIRNLGFPIREARISALRHLVVQVPAPVIADALGFHQTTTTRQVAHAGATWNRYPPRVAEPPAP